MRWFSIAIAVISWSSTLIGQEVKVLEFPDFTFECGSVVPQVKLAYTTLGTLNEQKSNAILLPSHYGADHTGYDYLIGRGKALDPANNFLILTNLFANGVSSSPSNTPDPFRGPRFPQVSIRDNVEAQHRLVREKLGISKLKAIVGFSMGGQQAFQWAVSHPQVMESIVVICGNAKQYPFGIVRLQVSIKALKADAEFMDGNYTRLPDKGLRALSMHHRAWTRSPEAWPRDLFDNLSDQEVEQALESLSEGFHTADANNLLSQAETWKRHDVGDTKGFGGNLQKALGSIQARVLLMPSTSDQYFPLTDAVFEAKLIPGAKLRPIQSVFGHTAGGGTDPVATTAMDVTIKEFLNPIGSQESNGRSNDIKSRQLAPATVATSSDGDKFLIGASKENPREMVAIPLDDASSANHRAARLKAVHWQVEMEILNRNKAREAKLLDKNGKPHSLREFAGRPHIVVLIKGAFCKLCMAQLAEFQQQLGPSKVPVVVVTPIDDLEELADFPFAVFADPEFNLFKSLQAFRDEPLHGTFVFNSRDEILLKDIGSEPFTDFAAIKKALMESLR
jgi:homoserine O-acetyltransferase